MKKIKWGKKMTKVSIDADVKNRLLHIRNTKGFLDLNHVVRFLLDREELATKKDIEEFILNTFGKDTPRKINVPKEAIPLIVPKPNVDSYKIREVTCPKCTHKFMADISKSIKCPVCGLEGQSGE